jgi:chromosome segregation protein
MFLKSLTLKGFKSFADPTTLEFEPGVTVVVGPNGSGKSNVVDAIAWVLGAQAPSAVRSQKMDDVIFAGTAKRPALGRAEVSLTIDNTAGLLPIGFTEVTLTRTLFRTGESEYAINAVPCRLLDIQELLSDSGVGRQQHVIVSQGQIDAVLNARPEDRRAIVEEAAGVLKFRKRKERSERRLESTEANLQRLQDLLREVRRQLRPLEKQADAARRHDAVAAELRALRLFLTGRELTSLRTRLTTAETERAQYEVKQAEVRSRLAALDADVMATEASLAAQGGSDTSDRLRHCESLRERSRGLGAVIAERTRSVERDRQALLGADVVATLEADAANVRAQLVEVDHAEAVLAPKADELATAQLQLEHLRDEVDAVEPESDSESVPAMNAAAEMRGELVALRASLAKVDGEQAGVDARLGQLAALHDSIVEEVSAGRDECARLSEAEAALVRSADVARARRTQADGAVAIREAALRAMESELLGAQARSDALESALDAARAAAGAERLVDADGMLGTLLDLVSVDAGWEAAFEAAAGEALVSVVFESRDQARVALEGLHARSLSGSVVAAQASPSWPPPPPIGIAVRSHVHGTSAAVNALLDRLLAGAVRVDGGWSVALDASIAHPEVIVVTDSGDRFGSGGWRLGSGSSGATAAALEQSQSTVVSLRDTLDRGREALAAARVDAAGAASAQRRVVEDLDGHDSRFAAASKTLARLQADMAAVVTQRESLATQRSQLSERGREERTRFAELELMLPTLEATEVEVMTRLNAQRMARAHLGERAATVATMRRELDVASAGLVERRQMLQRRLIDVEDRLARNEAQRAEAEQRRLRLDQTLVALERLRGLVARHSADVSSQWEVLDAERRRQSEAVRAVAQRLDGLRRQRSEAERELEELRERSRRGEIEHTELRLRLEQATEALRHELEVEPDAAMAALCPPLPEGATAPGRARELERELKLMGPINPLALEEFAALQERHQFLEDQLSDVADARRELLKVIRAVDTEIQNVFAAAYADVSENFTRLFDMLFPGGAGRLVLTTPNDLLNSGIEVEAKPSGKNVKKLSLLSGGERSLTALAFLFAVFRSRPSPFYVMDEVEAALDDVNLHRFLGLVNEFRAEAQLLVVSHQKRTMEAADCLYGVTMQPGGSSKVVSETVSAGR